MNATEKLFRGKQTVMFEDGIPYPEPTSAYEKINWEQFKVGSSFAVTQEMFGEYATERVRSALAIRVKATKEKYSMRKSPDGSYRCWRIA